jgi:hypothetical protein
MSFFPGLKQTLLKTPKIWITGAILLAFAGGVLFEGYTKLSVTNASSSAPAPTAAASAPGPALLPTSAPAQPASVQPAARPVAASTTAAPRRVRHKRSLEHEALIVGGSAGAGAAIGAVAGGGKGAGIGALSGVVAGLVYDLATRNK